MHINVNKKKLKIRNLGLRPIKPVLKSMFSFNKKRTLLTSDEIWLVQHYPVFTIGTKKTLEDFYVQPHHINIPILFNDRGGRVTYHGPGQLIVYILINLIRRKYSIHKLLSVMHKIIILTLNYFSINAYTIKNFPGVYVNNKKICSLGLRIKNGCSLHGMALNINMDLSPFNYINPCGTNFKMTQVMDIKSSLNFRMIQLVLIHYLNKIFV